MSTKQFMNIKKWTDANPDFQEMIVNKNTRDKILLQ